MKIVGPEKDPDSGEWVVKILDSRYQVVNRYTFLEEEEAVQFAGTELMDFFADYNGDYDGDF